MATFEIISYDGTDLNDANYNARLQQDNFRPQPPVQSVYVQRPQNTAVYAGSTPSEGTFPIVIDLLGNKHSQRSALFALFGPTVTVEKALIVKDTSDSDTPYHIMCKPEVVQEIDHRRFVVMMKAGDPTPEAESASTDTDNNVVASLPYAFVVTPGGNMQVQPTITFDATGAPVAGFTYHRYLTVFNQTDNLLQDYPLDVTGGGLDTGVLTTAKMLANGDDFRVYFNGVEVDRWLQDMDTANTLAWVVNTWSARVELTLLTAIGASGDISEIDFEDTALNRAALNRLPLAGILQIGTEEFTYTAKDSTLLKVTGVVRGDDGVTLRVRNTSNAAHSASVTVRLIQHDILIVYGNASASAPTQDAERTPMFNIADGSGSTNDLWVYADFQEQDVGRPGAWSALIDFSRNTEPFGTDFYTANRQTFADTAAEAGLRMSSFLSANVWQAEQARLLWFLFQPCGVDELGGTGEVYIKGSSWPNRVGLYGVNSISDWERLEELAKWVTGPSAEETWEAWTTTGWSGSLVALSKTYENAMLLLDGSVGAGDGNEASIEASDMRVSVATAPSCTVGAEIAPAGSYHLHGTLTHDDEGIAFDLDIVIDRADTLVVNCADLTATLSLDNRNVLGVVRPSSKRADWMFLNGGVANNLSWEAGGSQNLDIDFSWKDRQV